MTARLAFIDTETTGLDPERHEVWEVALIVREAVDLQADQPPSAADVEYLWQLPVDLGRADPMALTVGKFYDRAVQAKRSLRDPFDDNETSCAEFAADFARLTHGAHLVGAVVSFDAAFLSRLLRRNGACPGWHYHLIDVEALAVGYLAGTAELAGEWAPPWKSDELTAALGIDSNQFEKHTAMGDARWARAIYDRVVHGQRP